MTKNEQLTNYIKIRQKALKDLEDSIAGIFEMGVIFINPSEEDGAPEYSGVQNLLPRFLDNLEIFEWKAVYDDGTELDQYSGEEEHNFKNIDQSVLSKLIYISNFEIDTSNVEKRMVITLDFKNGTFDFLNCGAMDIRGQLDKPCLEDKKLIFWKRVSRPVTVGVDFEEKKLIPESEQLLYERYYLGYESSTKKVIICICPNGEIEIDTNEKTI